MKKGKKPSWQSSFEAFLDSELAERAARHLSDGAALMIYIDDKQFLYRRENGKNTLRETKEGAADAYFWLTSNTLHQLVTLGALPGTGLGTMGVAVFERMFQGPEADRIRFRLSAGLFGLWRKGYFSVLKAGGPEVASYLARLGQGGVSWLKDVLRKI